MRKHITPPQLKKLHTLLSKQHMMEAKAQLVHDYSNGRTTSSRELFVDEAALLITTLAKDDPCSKMKRKCMAICYELGFFEDGNDTTWKINWAVLDGFLLKRGVVKKAFKELTCKEVHAVLNQLEATLKHSNETAMRKEINADLDDLLTEIGISRASKSNTERRSTGPAEHPPK